MNDNIACSALSLGNAPSPSRINTGVYLDENAGILVKIQGEDDRLCKLGQYYFVLL